MKKYEFRIKPIDLIRFYPQFKDKVNILGINFIVWRYIPDSIFSGVKSIKKMPWIYLPYTTSHCYKSFFKLSHAVYWCGKNIQLDNYLQEYFNEFNQRTSNYYL